MKRVLLRTTLFPLFIPLHSHDKPKLSSVFLYWQSTCVSMYGYYTDIPVVTVNEDADWLSSTQDRSIDYEPQTRRLDENEGNGVKWDLQF